MAFVLPKKNYKNLEKLLKITYETAIMSITSYLTQGAPSHVASLVVKNIKGHNYYYAVESARVNGKPRITKQTYLGTLETMLEARKQKSSKELLRPDFGQVLEFGAVTSLFDLAERLKVRQIIDNHVGKRPQGLPVGDSLLLAAINRAVAPVSKKAFFGDWFDKTVLPNLFPKANERNLSSQGFWKNMSLVNKETIAKIEDEICANIVKEYNISTDYLLFDNTNFITYIDTDNPFLLAKRGKSKEHRTDLKIVGLSLMVSPDNNIPLFHEPYPGNTNDAKRFSEIIGSLKSRCQKINDSYDITLVFDRGNNSTSNIEKLIEDDPFSFHYVGGLKRNQCLEFEAIPINEFKPLEGDTFGETVAYRTSKVEFGREVTVVVTKNPELYKSQMRGVANNISKCVQELEELSKKLKEREGDKIFRGRPYTNESVKEKVKKILAPEHMKNIFEYSITKSDGNLMFTYQINEIKFDYVKEHILGKSILFTNRHGWSNEQIVGAYRAQHHVEECFKQMKNNDFLCFRPIRHYTDNNIIVHCFYCVLALSLVSVLNLEFKKIGHDISINKMLKELTKSYQMVNYYVNDKKITKTYTLTKLEGIIKDYYDKYKLDRYFLK
jgi:transposase